MATHLVEIGEEQGRSFKISVSIGYTGVRTTGSWRFHDKGNIRSSSAGAKKRQTPEPSAARNSTTCHLRTGGESGSINGTTSGGNNPSSSPG